MRVTRSIGGRRRIAPLAIGALVLELVLLPLSVRFAAQQSSAARTFASTAPAQVVDALRLVTEFNVNGLKVLVKRREGSQTVAAALFLRGGSRNVGPDDAGVESVMLDMATEATANFPRERLRRELARTGTVISAGVNPDYSGLTLSSTRQYFDRAWEIFTDAALHPSFAQDDFDRIKQQEIVALSDDEDTPDSYLQLLTSRQIYAGHPYLNNPHGTLDSVRRLTRDDLAQYHQKMMQTSRLLLVVVGDIDPKVLQGEDRGLVRQAAPGGLQGYARAAAVLLRAHADGHGARAADQLRAGDIRGPAHHVARHLSDAGGDDHPARAPLHRDSREAQPVLRAGREARRLGANTGMLSFTAVDANQTVQVMLNEVARLQSELIRPDEIRAVAQQFLTTYYMGQEQNAQQAAELAEYELIGGGWRRNPPRCSQQLRAVTPEDVRRVARTYIRNIQFIALGNPQSLDRAMFLNNSPR